MRLDELAGEALEAADEILDSAAHDVAKYMAMTARNVDPATTLPEDLAARLVEDVRRVDGRRPAWELWQHFSERLRALSSDDEILDRLDTSMVRVRQLAETEPVEHGALAQLVTDAAAEITALRRAVRRRMMEARSR